MLTVQYLLENKENIDGTANNLNAEDIEMLVSLLPEKNDEIRYQAFQVLDKRSELSDDVYPFWDIFSQKLRSENSYQRNIGVSLIAANIRWDHQDRLSAAIEAYLSCCNDEKPITSRLAIQSIGRWIGGKPQYWDLVKRTLFQIDLSKQRETMRKLILLDITGALVEIQKIQRSEDITEYLVNAMTGRILDKKSAKQLEPWV